MNYSDLFIVSTMTDYEYLVDHVHENIKYDEKITSHKDILHNMDWKIYPHSLSSLNEQPDANIYNILSLHAI